MTEQYDVIVLGVGGMGSATVSHLAERGVDVLGLERYDIPHGYGSSHGITRIFRLAYYEHPAYVPLLTRADELWTALESDHDQQLLHRTGSVDAGPRDGPLVEGSKRSCVEHDLDHEVLSSTELAERYPGYQLPEDYEAVYQPDGGYLVPEECIVAHVNRAHQHGATVRARERVVEWQSTADDGVRVETDYGIYEADRLVITAGAWAAAFVDELAEIAVPERQVLAWLQPEEPSHFEPDAFPVWNLQVPEGRYYGFPVHGVPGFKFGRYNHREETVDPEAFEREPTQADERLLRQFAEQYFPDGAGPTMRLETCLFTNTPDDHFVIDTLPDRPQVSVAAGFSGHGFKFASVIGEIMADLALEGETEHDIEMFSLDRF
ncbi:sarcosine oxidase [Natrialba magadii ATCC 43099]|uniref:N-methyltryptophan oxidase n=1 Tax=Natrialba magadii (strain ATCC 43099 / DSM 3394 / CCM 3739 / CIP 104546 / IAM 13178 / JCM 8861 / NBRC 102185 / NCIMB 2190 / MS3) TaxID=547559 RepID=D3SSV6_NATMM|nr:N-methyl-L-tryptophan oxidase [Natrialba magadii]ADD04902.1 sarcosine oxidase [Natrialba magadii ATCC 43099]ELY23951.1 N-methyltryptophan oxidase [Natrialba magadii ATCC 43099]